MFTAGPWWRLCEQIVQDFKQLVPVLEVAHFIAIVQWNLLYHEHEKLLYLRLVFDKGPQSLDGWMKFIFRLLAALPDLSQHLTAPALLVGVGGGTS